MSLTSNRYFETSVRDCNYSWYCYFKLDSDFVFLWEWKKIPIWSLTLSVERNILAAIFLFKYYWTTVRIFQSGLAITKRIDEILFLWSSRRIFALNAIGRGHINSYKRIRKSTRIIECVSDVCRLRFSKSYPFILPVSFPVFKSVYNFVFRTENVLKLLPASLGIYIIII